MTRYLLLIVALLTAACSKERESPSPAQRSEDKVLAAAAKPMPESDAKDIPTQDDHVYDHVDIDDDGDTPEQSPTQSPFQGDLPGLTITAVTPSGDGCADDTVAVNISDDAKAFTVLFADFIAELTADAEPTKAGLARDARRCRLALTLDVPQGYRLAVMSMDFRGFVDLESGANAKLTSRVTMDAQSSTSFVHEFRGPTSDDVAVRNELAIKTWSRCGGEATLAIDVEAAVTATGGATALLALDSADGEMTQKYGLAWRRCH